MRGGGLGFRSLWANYSPAVLHHGDGKWHQAEQRVSSKD